jgi:hypothetical protein
MHTKLYSEDLKVVGSMILKRILNKWNMRLLTESICQILGTCDRLLLRR